MAVQDVHRSFSPVCTKAVATVYSSEGPVPPHRYSPYGYLNPSFWYQTKQRSVIEAAVDHLQNENQWLWAWLCAVWNDWQSSVFIVKASTVINWHRKGFRLSKYLGAAAGRRRRPGGPSWTTT
jgi:hypothetical protein